MPPLRQTYHRQVKAANVPLRGVAPFPLVGLDRVASQQPPQGGIKRHLACRAGGATKGSTASSPESGAISHSRAAANVPLRGVAPFPLVGLDRVASQQAQQGALRQSEIAPCYLIRRIWQARQADLRYGAIDCILQRGRCVRANRI